MKTYLECWISSAAALFSQALAGQPVLTRRSSTEPFDGCIALKAEISGDVCGAFTLIVDEEILRTPLLGDTDEQAVAWAELAREVAEAAAGDLLATSGVRCKVDALRQSPAPAELSASFALSSGDRSWKLAVHDELTQAFAYPQENPIPPTRLALSEPAELLLDVGLDAALRFGCCEISLAEILELGPGDVLELDRHVSDPADLIVGDKIVARGEVVLVNENFGLRITEVATPQRRLETIRCLF